MWLFPDPIYPRDFKFRRPWSKSHRFVFNPSDISFPDISSGNGIYIIKYPSKGNYIYLGKSTPSITGGVRASIEIFLKSNARKFIDVGKDYEIRFVISTSLGSELIDEALSILFFQVKTDSQDWKNVLINCANRGQTQIVIDQARRLGFLKGSTKIQFQFYSLLLQVMT